MERRGEVLMNKCISTCIIVIILAPDGCSEHVENYNG